MKTVIVVDKSGDKVTEVDIDARNDMSSLASKIARSVGKRPEHITHLRIITGPTIDDLMERPGQGIVEVAFKSSGGRRRSRKTSRRHRKTTRKLRRNSRRNNY